MSWSSRWRLCALVVLTGALGACGFHLRGQATYTFSSVYVNVTGAPVFESELKRSLQGAGSAKLAPTAAAADVILDIPPIADEKDVLSLSSGGGVREYALQMRVNFRLHDKDGLDWLPPAEITVRRAYTFNETEVLARDAEEQRLLRDMQSDAIAQLIRRLQAAKKP
ncbi:MAG TPA: LPS assembly lipoprotein LptE [Casimicrobiaceae bacterium]|jgi:LPS-assembly lipoprotein